MEQDELDLDAMLEGNLELIAGLPEGDKSDALCAYIENQLHHIEKEKPILSAPDELLSEREKRLLEAMEMGVGVKYMDITLAFTVHKVETSIRGNLQPWERFGSIKSALTAEEFEEQYLQPYFDTVERLRDLGLELSEFEAIDLILDDLAEDIEQETKRHNGRTYDRHVLMWESNHRQVEMCAELFDLLDGKGGFPEKYTLLDTLYALIITPKAWVHYPRDSPSERVVLYTPEQSVSILEERFTLLEALEEKGYPVDYQRAADTYTEGLSSSQDFGCCTGELHEASRIVLRRLSWLDDKGADLSKLYGGLRIEIVEALNNGTSPEQYLPLLEFLTEHDAFDRGQLALLKATTYK